jgi:N-methylhydantoinase B
VSTQHTRAAEPEVSSAGSPTDPILAAVLQKRVEAVTLEMATSLLRTTRSTLFNQLGDFITAIFDASLRTLAQTEFAAVIAFGAQPSLNAVAAYFGDDIHEGDVIAHNDVFSRGNQLHDLGFYAPVFHEGTLIAWVACKGHQADLGGATAGGYNPRIREVWQEALRVPPVKLYEAGRLRRDLWDLIAANVRLDIVMEDIKSMIGACRLGCRRVTEIVTRYGLGVFNTHMDYVISSSERLVRNEIATWPDGHYHGESVMVSDGVDPLAQYRIVCDAIIDGDQITFDFSGTDDQAPGYTNMPASSAMGAVRIAFLMLLNASSAGVPANHGLFAPVRTVFRPGSLLDPAYPAATIFGNQMCDEVIESIMTALAPALPDRVVAGWNQALGTCFDGIDPRTGARVVFFGVFQRGGPGAVHGADGFDALGFTGAAGQMRQSDIETFEISHPMLVESYEFLPDSSGAGRWRGGLGTRTIRRILADQLSGSTLGDDVEAEGAPPAKGLFGGEDAGLNTLRIEYPDGSVRLWGSKERIDSFPYGTRMVALMGGGGGFGDPFLRQEELVAQEVKDGILTARKARDSYGVAVDDSGAVDRAATATLRGARDSEPTP